jgi:hypothetical protein
MPPSRSPCCAPCTPRASRTNRLPRTRKHYCPQGLHGFQEQDTARVCAFRSRWPPSKAVPRARRATLAPFGRAPHVR